MQNLAEYLASEQAREDVRLALASPLHSVAGCVLKDNWFLSRTEAEAWMCLDVSDNETQQPIVSAYYRPDGDRYVVTDLGEGWRAHRLRTGRVDWTSEIIAACDYHPNIVDAGERATAGDCEAVVLKNRDLPDAICRVMLASLRVAQS